MISERYQSFNYFTVLRGAESCRKINQALLVNRSQMEGRSLGSVVGQKFGVNVFYDIQCPIVDMKATDTIHSYSKRNDKIM
ncbi:hypothetical protein TNCV_3654201 [Trichonephila clavipes]|nr:hypothetical protein TNCV_3654201 [Trichonephila clavipes]